MPPRYQGEASTLPSWDTMFLVPRIRQGLAGRATSLHGHVAVSQH